MNDFKKLLILVFVLFVFYDMKIIKDYSFYVLWWNIEMLLIMGFFYKFNSVLLY